MPLLLAHFGYIFNAGMGRSLGDFMVFMGIMGTMKLTIPAASIK